MKEIDFLPEWYKSSKRRKINYRMQFLVIGGVFALMLSWSFAASYSNTVSQSYIDIMQKAIDSNSGVASKHESYNKKLALLEERAERLDKLAPKISIPAVLAEISYLATDNIMIMELDIQTELVSDKSESMKTGMVRLGTGKSDKTTAMPDADVRYKVVLHGVASGADSVTDLISQLEGSSYFCLVVPGLLEYVKETTFTRFEISCYVANYEFEEGK